MNSIFVQSFLRNSASLTLIIAVWCAVCADNAYPQGSSRIRLKAGDTLQIDVFDEPLVTGNFVITADGRINYPLLGKINVTGKTPDAVADSVEELLEKDYIRDARVTATVTARPLQTVLVIGQVGQPGRVSFEAESTIDLFTAIASAGGLTPNADKTRIEIGGRDGSRRTVDLDAGRKLSLPDGTNVVVPSLPLADKRKRVITVLGEVKSPGTLEIPRDQRIDLLRAIAMAGGFSGKARPSRITVTRADKPIKLNGTRMRKGLDKRFYLEDGDSIFVSESFF